MFSGLWELIGRHNELLKSEIPNVFSSKLMTTRIKMQLWNTDILISTKVLLQMSLLLTHCKRFIKLSFLSGTYLNIIQEYFN